MAEVLNALYEVDSLGFSYGFRPRRKARQALDALGIGIRFKKISWLFDADVRSYFDRISHEWVARSLEHRIADKRILRLVHKWLKARAVEDGQWMTSEEGPRKGPPSHHFRRISTSTTCSMFGHCGGGHAMHVAI